MLYFTKRQQARDFRAKNPDKYKIVDRGADFDGKRWGVKVL